MFFTTLPTKPQLKVTIFSLLWIASLAAPQAAIPAKAVEKRSARYTLVIDGYEVGRITHVWSRPEAGALHLKACEVVDQFGLDYTLSENFHWAGGMLESFSSDVNDDGSTSSIACSSKNGTFTVYRAHKGRRSKLNSFQLSEFDLLYQELPIHLATNGYPPKKTTLRFVDNESGSIFTGTVTSKGEENLHLAGRNFACKKIAFATEGMTATLWIATDEFGPFVVKEASESEIGNVVQELTTLRLDAE